MKRLSRNAVIVLLLSVGLAAPSSSYGDAASRRAAREAKKHYDQGRAHHDAGDYDRAIAEFLAAYAIVPTPALLFNIGQEYRRKGDKKKAVEYYQKVLLVEPDGHLSGRSHSAIAELTTEIVQEEADAAQRKAAEPVQAERHEPEARPLATPVEQPSAPIVPVAPVALSKPAPAPEQSDVENPGRGLRVAGLVTAIAGAASIGLAIKYGLDASGQSDKLTSGQVRTTADFANAVSDGEAAERNMYIFYGVGGGLLVTGGILYYYGARATQSERAVRVVPSIAPQTATLSVRGKF